MALNDASERQGTFALGLSLLCQGAGVILASVLAFWLTRTLIERVKWRVLVSLILATLAGTSLGTALIFLSTVISMPPAGIR